MSLENIGRTPETSTVKTAENIRSLDDVREAFAKQAERQTQVSKAEAVNRGRESTELAELEKSLSTTPSISQATKPSRAPTAADVLSAANTITAQVARQFGAQSFGTMNLDQYL